ncbi:MAG: rod shape-determining protein MreC [Ideonella sp.]|jgi:rod shape-determining protein MreC|nr:rod shape-determining protein MreC [Ideonella sp.]
MPLGTLDRTPPPFFRQGLSALTKLAVFSAAAVFLMVADTRFGVTEPLRAAIATVLHPTQRLLLAPVEAVQRAGDHLGGLRAALDREAAAQAALAEQSALALEARRLREENERLRGLLDLQPTLPTPSRSAQVLFEQPDPFSRRVVIDAGLNRGLVIASPVINERGVVGQVTRVFPLSAEVTLLSDKDAAIPVMNLRTGQRGVAFGSPSTGGLEMRFVAGNADIRVDDPLVTSGLDGVYPPGLPVARVAEVERRTDATFARIGLASAVALDAVRHVLVLTPAAQQMPVQPESAPPASGERPR